MLREPVISELTHANGSVAMAVHTSLLKQHPLALLADACAKTDECTFPTRDTSRGANLVMTGHALAKPIARLPAHDGSRITKALRFDSNTGVALEGRLRSHDVTSGGRIYSTPIFRHLSTSVVPPDCRFKYWRRHFTALRMSRPYEVAHDSFNAAMLHTTPSHGLAFVHLANDPLVCHFGGRDPDSIMLMCIRSGVVYVHHGRGAITTVSAKTGIILVDQDRPLVAIQPRPFAMVGLKLPRLLVVEALGSEAVRPDQAVRSFLQPDPLLLGLLVHLDEMAECGRRPDPRDIDEALGTARSLVMTILARQNQHRWSLPETFDDALLAAARYQLNLHSSNAEITAEQAAAMLGCSRAHLYRVFAREGHTVAGVLREARLQRARVLLEQATGRDQIGAVAWQCGYTDFSAFGKAFHRRFSMTPSDCRYRAQPVC